MNLTDRVKNILLQPAREWAVIEQEPATVADLYRSYIVPLAAIGPVASIIGLSLIGVRFPYGGTFRVPLATAIAHAVINYLLTLAGVYGVAWIINALAPTFQGAKSTMQALKVAAYSSTAAWLAGIFMILPVLGFLQILGLYSVYLLYLGLPALMKAPQEKALVYTIVVLVAALVVFAVIGAMGAVFVSYPPSAMMPMP